MNDAPVTFTVYGTPKPQGSKRHVGGGVLVESGGQAFKDWRHDMTIAARDTMQARLPLEGALEVDVTFTVPKPKSAKAHARPTKRPDVDKLARALLDALTAAGVLGDDSQVTNLHARKAYPGDPGALPIPGAHVTVRPETGDTP